MHDDLYDQPVGSRAYNESHEKIDISTVVKLAAVIEAVKDGVKIARLRPDNTVEVGTLRHLCKDESGNFAHGDADPMETLVRITWMAGFDSYPKLSELADGYATGDVFLYYEG